MRKNVIFFSGVLLIAIVILSGYISTQSISMPGPTPTPQIEYVTVLVTPTPTQSTPTPQIIYVTVTVPITAPVEQSTADIQMIGNVYGLASNPLSGIDEIRFIIGLAPGAPSIDLTKMKILFSTTNTSSIVLTQGDTANTTVFTTKLVGGKNLRLSGPIAIPVNGMDDNSRIEIAFKTDPIKANTKMNIELRPAIGAALPFSKTTPATISATNLLY